MLRCSHAAWVSLTLPVNSVIVPFLHQGGVLLDNDPGKLFLNQLMLYLTVVGGQTPQEYADAVLAVFTALRAARDTTPSVHDPVDWITPRTACRRQ